MLLNLQNSLLKKASGLYKKTSKKVVSHVEEQNIQNQRFHVKG